jgi:hypothetical protein
MISDAKEIEDQKCKEAVGQRATRLWKLRPSPTRRSTTVPKQLQQTCTGSYRPGDLAASLAGYRGATDPTVWRTAVVVGYN